MWLRHWGEVLIKRSRFKRKDIQEKEGEGFKVRVPMKKFITL